MLAEWMPRTQRGGLLQYAFASFTKHKTTTPRSEFLHLGAYKFAVTICEDYRRTLNECHCLIDQNVLHLLDICYLSKDFNISKGLELALNLVVAWSLLDS